MKHLIAFVILILLFISADNGAQTRCLTCPEDTIVKHFPIVDSVKIKLDTLQKLQDSLLIELKSQYDKKSIRPLRKRSEVVQLLTGRYRYDWYYNKNGFSHLKIKKL